MRKKRERDGYLEEKDPGSPKNIMSSRMSSMQRTGNAMVLRFNTSRSEDMPPPPRSARKGRSSNLVDQKEVVEMKSDMGDNGPSTPPPFMINFMMPEMGFSKSPPCPSSDLARFDFGTDVTPAVPSTLAASTKKSLRVSLLETIETTDTVPYLSPARVEDVRGLDFNFVQRKEEAQLQPSLPSPDRLPDDLESPIDEKITKVIPPDIPEEAILDRPEPSEIDHWDDVSIAEDDEPSNLLNKPVAIQDSVFEVLNDIIPTIEAAPIEDIPRSPFLKPTATRISEAASMIIRPNSGLLALEALLPPQKTRVPAPETLALLRRDEEPRSLAPESGDEVRNSTVPEIDTILRMVAEKNGVHVDKPLFWTDFRAPYLEVEEVVRRTTREDFEMVPDEEILGISSPKEDMGEELAIFKERQRSVSPSPHSSESILPEPIQESKVLVGKPGLKLEIPVEETPTPQLVPTENPETSPLRQNPQIRNITFLLAEKTLDSSPSPDSSSKFSPENERKARGRSMIRTSDIIEARLSQVNPPSPRLEPIPQQTGATKGSRDRTLSPLRQNPVDPEVLTRLKAKVAEDRERTLSPLRRNPSNVIPSRNPSKSNLSNTTPTTMKRRSASLPPVPKPTLATLPIPLKTTSPPSPPSREQSPLRRNPSNSPLKRVATPSLLRAASQDARPASNIQFEKLLNRFQDMAQNERIRGQARDEVTTRAMKGIYIPGSLREQAVRNASKSRERKGS